MTITISSALPWTDIALVAIVVGFVLYGFFSGLARALGNLVGMFLSIYLTSRWIDPVMGKLAAIFGTSSTVRIILFMILLALISRLVGLGFYLLEKLFGFLSWIPFAKSVNRILGAIFGLLEGLSVVGALVFFIIKYVPLSALRPVLEHSTVAIYFQNTIQNLLQIVPPWMRLIPLP